MTLTETLQKLSDLNAEEEKHATAATAARNARFAAEKEAADAFVAMFNDLLLEVRNLVRQQINAARLP